MGANSAEFGPKSVATALLTKFGLENLQDKWKNRLSGNWRKSRLFAAIGPAMAAQGQINDLASV